MNDLTRNIVLWVVIAIVLLAVFSNFGQRAAAPTSWRIRSSSPRSAAAAIRSATFKGDTIVGERASGGPYVTHNPETDNSSLIGLLDKQRIASSMRRRPSARASCCSCSFPRSRSCC